MLSRALSYEGDITDDELILFEKKFANGELKPSLKSEEPKPEDTAEPVKVLRGKSFPKMVLDNGEGVVPCNLPPVPWYICSFSAAIVDADECLARAGERETTFDGPGAK